MWVRCVNSKRICLIHNRCGVGKENRIQWNDQKYFFKIFTRFYSLVSYLLVYLIGHHCVFTNKKKGEGKKKRREKKGGKGWTFPNKEIKDKKEKGGVLIKEWKIVDVFMILFGSERVSWR